MTDSLFFIDADEVLAHHGVKGMKWGVRKQRPSGGAGPSRKRKGLSRKQKAAIAGVLGTAAAVGAGYYLHKTGNDKKIAAAVKKHGASAKEFARGKGRNLGAQARVKRAQAKRFGMSARGKASTAKSYVKGYGKVAAGGAKGAASRAGSAFKGGASKAGSYAKSAASSARSGASQAKSYAKGASARAKVAGRRGKKVARTVGEMGRLTAGTAAFKAEMAAKNLKYGAQRKAWKAGNSVRNAAKSAASTARGGASGIKSAVKTATTKTAKQSPAPVNSLAKTTKKRVNMMQVMGQIARDNAKGAAVGLGAAGALNVAARRGDKKSRSRRRRSKRR